MTVGTTEAIRQTTVSGDRTRIVVEQRCGTGSVAGARHDRRPHPLGAMLPLFEPYATVHAMDRRGRGGSGDSATYTLAAEADDVAAVVDAIGRPVDVFGHSYGALVALEAALRVVECAGWSPVRAGARHHDLPEETARMERALTEGRREDVITILLRDLAGMADEQLAVSRSLPSWEGRVAAAHTVVREARAEETTASIPPASPGSGCRPSCSWQRRARRGCTETPTSSQPHCRPGGPDRPRPRGDAVRTGPGGGPDPRFRARGGG